MVEDAAGFRRVHQISILHLRRGAARTVGLGVGKLALGLNLGPAKVAVVVDRIWTGGRTGGRKEGK